MAQIKPEEVDVFLKGGGALDIASVRKKPKVGLWPACHVTLSGSQEAAQIVGFAGDTSRNSSPVAEVSRSG